MYAVYSKRELIYPYRRSWRFIYDDILMCHHIYDWHSLTSVGKEEGREGQREGGRRGERGETLRGEGKTLKQKLPSKHGICLRWDPAAPVLAAFLLLGSAVLLA
jgi:hypothetical protein